MKYAGEYYSKLSLLSKTRSNLNYLCWNIEKWEKKIRYKRKFQDTSKHMIDKSIPWSQENCDKVEAIYLRFNKVLSELSKQNYMARRYDDYKHFFEGYTKKEVQETTINWDIVYNEYLDEVNKLGLSDSELANYAVYISYIKYPKRSKTFCWNITGTGIIKNLLHNKKECVKLPMETCDAKDTEYLGRYYKMG